MKRLAKAFQYIGVTAFFFGGAAMDSPSLVAPIIMIFAGLGITYIGMKIEEDYV